MENEQLLKESNAVNNLLDIPDSESLVHLLPRYAENDKSPKAFENRLNILSKWNDADDQNVLSLDYKKIKDDL